MKKIVVTVSRSGDTKVEAFGFSGVACLAATREIEEAIGEVTKRKSKSGPDTVKYDQKVTQS